MHRIPKGSWSDFDITRTSSFIVFYEYFTHEKRIKLMMSIRTWDISHEYLILKNKWNGKIGGRKSTVSRLLINKTIILEVNMMFKKFIFLHRAFSNVWDHSVHPTYMLTSLKLPTLKIFDFKDNSNRTYFLVDHRCVSIEMVSSKIQI